MQRDPPGNRFAGYNISAAAQRYVCQRIVDIHVAQVQRDTLVHIHHARPYRFFLFFLRLAVPFGFFGVNFHIIFYLLIPSILCFIILDTLLENSSIVNLLCGFLGLEAPATAEHHDNSQYYNPQIFLHLLAQFHFFAVIVSQDHLVLENGFHFYKIVDSLPAF